MNFVGKFDVGLPGGGDGLHPKPQMHVDSTATHAPKDSIVVEDAHLLFTGDFKRTGSDLVISKDGHEVVVYDSLYKLIDDGQVKVNQKPAKANHQVAQGDEITVEMPDGIVTFVKPLPEKAPTPMLVTPCPNTIVDNPAYANASGSIMPTHRI